MAETRVTCPECDTVLRLRDPVPPGKPVRCPSCDAKFRPRADDGDDAPVARKGDRDRRRDDDYDDRPPRSRSGKKRPQKQGSGAVIALVAVAAVLLLGGAAVAVAVLWPSRSDQKAVATGPDGAPPKVAAKAGNPTASAPNPADAKQGLEIGNLAPDIDGEDIDGERFKLSDYRGKVVVLDFWGHW